MIPPVSCRYVGNTSKKIQASKKVHIPFVLIINEVLVASISFRA